MNLGFHGQTVIIVSLTSMGTTSGGDWEEDVEFRFVQTSFLKASLPL